LLGSLIFRLLWNAAQGRIALPKSMRRPFMVYADEFQDLLGLSGDFAELAAQGRKYGVGLTVAHQYLAQVPRDVQKAVLANTGTVTVQDSAEAGSQRLPWKSWRSTASGFMPCLRAVET
jgi:hypothetical protein